MRTVAVAAIVAILASSVGAAPLPLTARPIVQFNLASVDQPGGRLTFIGGLQLSSSEEHFGGFSGIAMPDADEVLLVGDRGFFMRARLEHSDGRLVGISDADFGPLFPEGETSKRQGDAEDIALDPANPERGVLVRERQANALLAFDLSSGRPANFEAMRVGAPDRLLRSNKGLESVAFAPPASPLAGSIVAIAERPPRGQTDIPGWIAGVGEFSIVRRDGFDISSARFLPNGDLVLLERRATPAWLIGFRLRLIDGAKIAVGARLDGDDLIDAGLSSQIDNMEGLAVSTDAEGRTILTLVSDDNYSYLQRTLILQFALAQD